MTTTRRRASSTDVLTRAPARRGHGGNPGLLIALGLLLEFFALLVITLQTQTNEAFINGTQYADGNILQAQWSIWTQLPKLVFGDAIWGPDVHPDDLPGIVIGQGVELVYLALVAGLEIALHTSNKLGRLLGAIVVIFLALITIFNFYTDLVYGNVSPTAHVMFALFCTLVAGFFPSWGIALIEHGWKRL